MSTFEEYAARAALFAREIRESAPNVFEFTESAVKAATALCAPGELFAKITPLVRAPFPQFAIRTPKEFFIVKEGSDGNFFEVMTCTGPCALNFVFSVDDAGFNFGALQKDSKKMVMAFPEGPELRAVGEHIVLLIAYLNCPKLLELEVVDHFRLNARRRREGKPEKPSFTRVRPNHTVREYLSGRPPAIAGEMPEHWVRGHWRVVWCGPKNQPQRPEPRWVLPFKRGNPEHGTKNPNYLVQG